MLTALAIMGGYCLLVLALAVAFTLVAYALGF